MSTPIPSGVTQNVANLLQLNTSTGDLYVNYGAPGTEQIATMPQLLSAIEGVESQIPDISGKANTDGSNATGTWGINISGNAATATNVNYWNGMDFTTDVGDAPSHILGYNPTGVTVRRVSSAGMKNFVGLDNGSILNNNISGSAAKWNGFPYGGSSTTSNISQSVVS